MRVCSRNPEHRRLGATRCEVPGCGALVRERPDPDEPDTLEPKTSESKTIESVRPELTTGEPEKTELERTERAPPGTTEEPLSQRLVLFVVIKHQTGSKMGRTEFFRADDTTTLTLGRDPGSTIAFDPVLDDVVSRHHAVIRVASASASKFTIADVGSRNGTYLNAAYIAAEEDLRAGDTIKLGASGPSFLFDIQSRPAP